MRLLRDPAYLGETIAAIYDCVLEPSRWQDTMLRLAGEIGAQAAYLGVVTANGGFGLAPVMHGLPSVDEMLAHAGVNPFLPVGLAWPFDQVFVVSRDYDRDALLRTRYHRDYLAPNGMRDAMMATVTREGGSFGHWLLITGEDRDLITAEEAAGIQLVAPHIRRAVEISRVLGQKRLEADTYRSALGQLDSPVLILDGERRVTHANPRADAAIAGGQVLRQRDGKLRGATDEVERLLRRVAEEAVKGGAAGFEAAVTGTDGEERLLFAVSLDQAGEHLLGQPARSVMLVLRSPREDTRNPISIAARVFNLTAAQVQVLAFLAQGHAPDDIAGILGISLSTVRSHLADLFGKTGTSRQAELVARTLSLASPLRGDAAT